MTISDAEYALFKSVHTDPNSKTVYLKPKEQVKGQLPSYYTVSEAPEFISEYAFHRFDELSRSLETNNFVLKENLLGTAQLIYGDYKKNIQHLPWYQRAFHRVCCLIGIRKTNAAVEALYQKIQKQAQPVALTSHLKGSEAELEERRAKHREPVNKDYGKQALSKVAFSPGFLKDLEVQHPEIFKLPPDERAIAIAKKKEESFAIAYDGIDARIEAGFYDPAIIPLDIEKLLGKVEAFDGVIVSQKELNRLLEAEVRKYQQDGKLNGHQAEHLIHDAISIAKRYLNVFPDKSLRDAFFFTRDLIRVATYQEYYDKAAFTGSDHGSKHIHHNIRNALAMHKGMEKLEDYNSKDKFLEQLVHFYHDIGYTTGLSVVNFDCCKDHPFIGANMIDSMKEYFVHYLDEDSFTTLRDCVLYHAIVNPDLTAREARGGHHPGMVRAVTSISDACAVTYDRKTQEFWEQPKALVALARLKSFVVLYPEYKMKLGDDIVKGPWKDYDVSNPLDVMAYETYRSVVDELNGLVTDSDIPDQKKDLFRQAINQQFNAFTANVTLGQYGAQLVGVGVVRNQGKGIREDAPDYLPKISLAPSILYGILRDLFGDDQANASFRKLVEEFNGNMDDLQSGLEQVASALDRGEKVKTGKILTGNAVFRLLNRFDHDINDNHMRAIQDNLRMAVGEIHGVFRSQLEVVKTRQRVMVEFDKWAKNADRPLFAVFATQHLLPALTIDARITEMASLLEFIRQSKLSPEDINRIRNCLRLLLLSDEEYNFMRGKEGRSEVYSQLLPQKE